MFLFRLIRKRKPTIGGPCKVVCNNAWWWRPAGPKSKVNGWPQASVGKKAAPSSSRKNNWIWI